MQEAVRVRPVPVQRSALDVATELTELYYGRVPISSVEDMENIFMKFYTMADAADNNNYNVFKKYLPDDMKDALAE